MGHQFFWSLKAEMHLPEVSERFGLLLQEYLRCCGPHRDQLLLQSAVEQMLIKVANLVKAVPKSERVPLMRSELSAMRFPDKFQVAPSYFILHTYFVLYTRELSAMRLPDKFQVAPSSTWCSASIILRIMVENIII